MSWDRVDPELRDLAERVCTRKQLDVLKLRSANASWRYIAQLTGTTVPTVREHFDRASLRIRLEVAAMRGIS